VKGGEDLRNDQRVEQMFATVNSILQKDPTCQKKDLKLITYAVVPITMNAGMLEWIDKTEVLNNVYGHGSGTVGKTQKKECHALLRKKFNMKFDRCSEAYERIYRANRGTADKEYKEKVDGTFSHDQFSKLLRDRAATPEVYIALRSKTIGTLAVINIAGYLLGIGDRHLGNCLLRDNDFSLIPIDFGHTFGSASFLLPIPELIPFRLDPQMESIMAPHPGRNGALRLHSFHILKAFVRESRVLLDSMQVFVNDPLMEWRPKQKPSRVNSGTGSGEALEQVFAALSVESQREHAFASTKKKLDSESPFTIIHQTVLQNKHSKFVKYKDSVLEFIKQKRGEFESSVEGKYSALDADDASVMKQVDGLMFLATDRQVHLRSYLGLSLWS
jgi:DNA-dependent protein kinase catalytic subunit